MGRLQAFQTEEQREEARETARLGKRNLRGRVRDQQRNNLQRNPSSVDLNRVAFLYYCTIDYSSHPFVRIGQMDFVYEHCSAL